MGTGVNQGLNVDVLCHYTRSRPHPHRRTHAHTYRCTVYTYVCVCTHIYRLVIELKIRGQNCLCARHDGVKEEQNHSSRR
jgi:hypothetical protein